MRSLNSKSGNILARMSPSYYKLYPCSIILIYFVYILISSSIMIGIKASENEERLLEDLFRSYNKLIRPVMNKTDHLVVKFGMALIQLINVDLTDIIYSWEKNFFIVKGRVGQNEIQQILKTNVWLRLIWYDYQLTWDPSDYGNVKNIRISYHRIWTPDIVLFNNADGKYEVSTKCNVVLHNDGQVLWVPPSIYKSTCIMDVKYFPFDQQHCEMKFGSWTFNGDEVGLSFYDDKDYIDLNDYSISGTWDIINVPGTLNVYNYTDKPKKTDITFHLYIRRKTLFYTVNLLAPCIMMSFMSSLVFYLPPDGNEKITLGISILLAIVLFQLVVAKILPPTSVCIPLISKYLLFTFIVNLLCLLFTLVIVNWNFREGSIHPITPILRAIFIECLPKYVGMKRPCMIRPSQSANMLKSLSKLNVIAGAVVTPSEYGGLVGVKLPLPMPTEGPISQKILNDSDKKNQSFLAKIWCMVRLCSNKSPKSSRRLSTINETAAAYASADQEASVIRRREIDVVGLGRNDNSLSNVKNGIGQTPQIYRNPYYTEEVFPGAVGGRGGHYQVISKSKNASKWLNLSNENLMNRNAIEKHGYENKFFEVSGEDLNKSAQSLCEISTISANVRLYPNRDSATLPVLPIQQTGVKEEIGVNQNCLKFKCKRDKRAKKHDTFKPLFTEMVDPDYDDDLLIKWQQNRKLRQTELASLAEEMPKKGAGIKSSNNKIIASRNITQRHHQAVALYKNDKRWNGIDYRHYQQRSNRKKLQSARTSNSCFTNQTECSISQSSSTRPLFEHPNNLSCSFASRLSSIGGGFDKNSMDIIPSNNVNNKNNGQPGEIDRPPHSKNDKGFLKQQKISFDISTTSDTNNNGSSQSNESSGKRSSKQLHMGGHDKISNNKKRIEELNTIADTTGGYIIHRGNKKELKVYTGKKSPGVNTGNGPAALILSVKERYALIHNVTRNVTFVANHIKNEDEAAIEKEDWKYIAIVIDRILLYIFIIVSIAGTVGIIISAPHIFEYVDQQERIQYLTGKKSE